ncbi:MAG: Bax inhibitor-1/YccA family protein [Ilumatobacteraceae bacterium]
MPNPVLNDKAFSRAVARTPEQSGWASPTGTSQEVQSGSNITATTWNPPVSDGPVTPWRSDNPMTASGAVSATLFLMVVLIAAATFGWIQVPDVAPGETATFPAWTLIGMLVGLGCALFLTFKPTLARFLAPVYAVATGVAVGAISKAYNEAYSGIVLQAVGATLGVFVVMLVAYRTGIIRVTARFRRVVVGATLGVMVFYGVSLLLGLFGADIFPQGSSLMSIGFSFLVAGIAAMNLALDFDFIEKAEAAGAPKYMEWYAAFGLLVTLVWLYLEILRLLSKMRDR